MTNEMKHTDSAIYHKIVDKLHLYYGFNELSSTFTKDNCFQTDFLTEIFYVYI